MGTFLLLLAFSGSSSFLLAPTIDLKMQYQQRLFESSSGNSLSQEGDIKPHAQLPHLTQASQNQERYWELGNEYLEEITLLQEKIKKSRAQTVDELSKEEQERYEILHKNIRLCSCLESAYLNLMDYFKETLENKDIFTFLNKFYYSDEELINIANQDLANDCPQFGLEEIKYMKNRFYDGNPAGVLSEQLKQGLDDIRNSECE